jgi:endo-1,4-beta-xylanase
MDTNEDKRLFSRNVLALLLIFVFLVFSCNEVPEEEDWGGPPVPWNTVDPLKDRYENYFLMGNIISPGDLGKVRFDILKYHYNTVTAENHMKPENIVSRDTPWAYQFNNADPIVNAALAEGMNVVGHTLIWHDQTPAWLTTGNAATVEANLNKYVTDVVDHFKGKLISWDVVNEAMRDGLSENQAAADWKSCLRPLPQNRWLVIGPEYIEKAFLAARAADPNVKLYYNDYNLNGAAKATAVYNMVKNINERYPNVGGRRLIDGIGMQSHHHLGTASSTVEASIKMFAELGVEIAISEMDIQAAGNLPVVGTVTWGDDAAKKQAAQYAYMFRIFKRYRANISRVTFWGIDDGTSWRSSSYPTLLDKDYKLKHAFYAVMNP